MAHLVRPAAKRRSRRAGSIDQARLTQAARGGEVHRLLSLGMKFEGSCKIATKPKRGCAIEVAFFSPAVKTGHGESCITTRLSEPATIPNFIDTALARAACCEI
jgi:hypothetical protein